MTLRSKGTVRDSKIAEITPEIKPVLSEYLKKRVQLAAQKAGGSGKLAKKSGINARTLGNYLSGRNQPKTLEMVAIARAAGVTVEWLATGEGEMRRAPRTPGEAVSDFLWSAGERIASSDTTERFVSVPRYDIEASAGPGALADRELIVGYMGFQEHWVRQVLGVDPKGLVLISASGDSMEPTIRSGDLLLVDTAVTAFFDDAIYVIAMNDHLIVKRVQHLVGEGGIIVKSDNERAYQPQRLGPESVAEVRVAGRVRWVGRML